ncbi:MAG: lysostaphin resistance A-like protein [Candidatus Limnocylindria bacterium]
MPAWPGWLPVLIGGAGLVIGLVLTSAAAAAPEVLSIDAVVGLLAMLGGALLFTGGLLYLAIRSIIVRRHLPPSRYRGPSILVMLGLALVLTSIASLFAVTDAIAIFEGQGRPSLAGSLILLTAAQLSLLLMVGLLVVLPRALVGAPSLGGPDALRGIGLGLGFGAVGWLGSSAMLVAIAALLGLLGIAPPTQPAEQALEIVDPVVLLLALVLVAPVAEETFYRGVAYTAWLRERGGRFALIGSSALFAVSHFAPAAGTPSALAAAGLTLLPFFGLGLALAWVYSLTRSLLAPIVMHATVNGISVALGLLVRFDVIRLPT